jgi:hypothetical protein
MSEPSQLVLAADGIPLARVRVRDSAPDVEQFAAEELRRHLHELAGASPALRRQYPRGGPVILVGDPDGARAAGIMVPPLGPEAFHIETRDGAVHVVGGGPRGVLYGVYDLLERLGCRWFTPDVTVIARARKIVLEPLAVTESPAFELRDMSVFEAGDPLYWVRSRLNGGFAEVPEHMGGNVTYGMFVHTFFELVPPAELFGEHPEYFSLVSGSRTREGQLCLTNPDVLRLVIGRVLAKMRACPRATLFSVSQNDWHGACECPACRAVVAQEGSESGPVIRFANAVAEATSKVFPGNIIDTLAYAYTLDPPAKARPHPNVRVRLCSIRCCQGHGLGTCGHPESARFVRALEGWSKLAPQMHVWHYITNFAHYPMPMANLDELPASFAMYLRHGVCGVFAQGDGEDGGGAELSALRAYLVSRLLWDPSRPAWPIVDEFLSAVYGRAASGVRAYLDLLHERMRTDGAIHPSLYDTPEHPIFDRDVVARADCALAEGAARVSGAERSRVRLLRCGLDYVRLSRAVGRFERTGDVYQGEANETDAEQARAMVTTWRKAGVRVIHEGTPWQFSVAKLLNRLVSHQVQWLRDAEHGLVVVPGLGGRIVEWHAFGRQWLSQPEQGGPFWQTYPLQEGYQESCYLGPFSHIGWVEAYSVKRRTDGLLLVANLDDGMRMTRLFHLRAGALTVKSRIENRSRADAVVGWGAAVRLVLPGPAHVTIGSAQRAWSDLPEGYDAPWLVEGTEGCRIETDGFLLAHRHEGALPMRTLVSRIEQSRKLVIDVKTDRVSLAPGERIQTSQRWEIIPRQSVA